MAVEAPPGGEQSGAQEGKQRPPAGAGAVKLVPNTSRRYTICSNAKHNGQLLWTIDTGTMASVVGHRRRRGRVGEGRGEAPVARGWTVTFTAGGL